MSQLHGMFLLICLHNIYHTVKFNHMIISIIGGCKLVLFWGISTTQQQIIVLSNHCPTCAQAHTLGWPAISNPFLCPRTVLLFVAQSCYSFIMCFIQHIWHNSVKKFDYWWLMAILKPSCSLLIAIYFLFVSGWKLFSRIYGKKFNRSMAMVLQNLL